MGYDLNVGRIIEQSILDYVNDKFSGNIPHPTLITLLCIKGGVTFSEVEEERCPKSSPLTLTEITTSPVEGERREKGKKRKIAEVVEVPRELVPTTEHEEEIHSEERGGFEAHSEQPVLSPTGG